MLDKSSLGPEAEITTNAQGGKQSATLGRFDLLPAHATMRVAGVIQHGAGRYAPNNWRKIDMASHLNHALQHIFALMDGDQSDDHLGHAACRMMMALEVEENFDFKACPEDEPKAARETLDNYFAEPNYPGRIIEDFDGEIDSRIAAATTFGTRQELADLPPLEAVTHELREEPTFSLKSLFGKIGKATPKAEV